MGPAAFVLARGQDTETLARNERPGEGSARDVDGDVADKAGGLAPSAGAEFVGNDAADDGVGGANEIDLNRGENGIHGLALLDCAVRWSCGHI